MSKIEQIQTILGVVADGWWGPRSQAALDAVIKVNGSTARGEHRVKASSFADPADVAAFRKCKATGRSDEECFKVGDNGIGCWGDDTTGVTPMCALPPEDMEERWGATTAAKHKHVLVQVCSTGRTVTCVLGDRMPRRAKITNGAGIDLNPAACEQLGLKPPMMVDVVWSWA